MQTECVSTVFAVLAGKLKPELREDTAPVAGKSTLNRMEHTPKRDGAKYHKVDCNREDVDGLFVDVFLESHKRPRRQIVLWMRLTSRCTDITASSVAITNYCYLLL